MNRNWDAAFAACKSYEEAEVSAALQAAVDAAGGLDWVTPGMRVALKLNLVSAMKPEQAATVHPAVVCALVKLLTARGAHVILGDSPGGLYTAAHLQRVYDDVRPTYSVLDNMMLRLTGIPEPLDWKTALKEYLEETGGIE